MKVSAVGCCPCEWPYFLTLSYISGRKNPDMEQETTTKPASLPLKGLGRPPVSIDTPSDTTDSVKSPDMSTDSGFEGEHLNRPSLLHTSPSKEVVLGSWRSATDFAGSESTSPKSPKKSTDDSDFNESPLDKKSVPDAQSESDEECISEHGCSFFATMRPRGRPTCEEDKKLDRISAFGICLEGDDLNKDCEGKDGRIGECFTCHKVQYIRCRNCTDCSRCSPDIKWCRTISSVRECKNHVIYTEGEANSEDEYELHGKPDTETDTSDEKVFEATYSDETLSAYYVPSNVSVAAEEFHLSVRLPEEQKTPICEDDEGEEEQGSPCLCHIGMCKSERCHDERSKYTTVLKPKAVRPTTNPDRRDHRRSSLESLRGRHVVAVIGQHHDRLSAFHERPSSSLSQNDGMHYFFSRSLDVPPLGSPIRGAASRPSDFPSSESLILSDGVAAGYASPPEEKPMEVDPKLQDESPRSKLFGMPWDLFCKGNEGTRYDPNSEPIHMTLEEVHSSLQTLGPRERRAAYSARQSRSVPSDDSKSSSSSLGFLSSYLRQKKKLARSKTESEAPKQKKSLQVIIRSAFNHLFGLKKGPKSEGDGPSASCGSDRKLSPDTSPFANRALPPLPLSNSVPEWVDDDEQWTIEGCHSQIYDRESQEDFERRKMDYAASIERVKDCGWYWGPISGETAEGLLRGEPDGSFVVRDSSDEHYIFSLTFKLNGLVRHVRIEHDHGNFSFGCLQKFRSATIVDFIDSAVAHSRSGRYLFFLHRRPVLGPMRVQLLHPVSRFKQVQSLQHLCRFVILRSLRRDLIDRLPLPRRLKDYLDTPHYYAEELDQHHLRSTPPVAP
ncbi:uncharacterized protein LOC129232082 [Uloborus diversus]|uniref:uncharacterized protein LOC129232082 n=1 Tax=Uloborus diversus TaxID=327109 RepID=UPI00240A92EF|nr:uncharacterized protein LOC129232082 [Uloborus diversus]